MHDHAVMPLADQCHACGRPLRDAVSRETGVGPSCARSVRAQGNEPRLFQAHYFVEIIDGVLVLFDCGSGSTRVTDDLERILLDEHRVRGRLPASVIVRDSLGAYDQVRHRDGAFGGIILLRVGTLADALDMVRKGQRA